MTITTKENAAGRISGYYVDGKRVAKKDLEAMLVSGTDEIITVDYSVALALKPMGNYYVMKNLKVVVTGVYQSGVLMTLKAVEAQGLELGRGWSGAIKALWRVKGTKPEVNEGENVTAEETVETAAQVVETENTDTAAEENVEVTAGQNVETEAQEVGTEEVSVSELVAAPAAEISPDEELTELFSAGKKAWEAQRDKSFNSTQAETFRAATKAITKFLDTTRGAFKAALPENIIVADNWREGEFSGSSDLPSFVIRDLKTGKTLGTYKTLAEVKAAIEGNTSAAQEIDDKEVADEHEAFVLRAEKIIEDCYNTKGWGNPVYHWYNPVEDDGSNDDTNDEPSVFSLLPDIDSLRDVEDTEPGEGAPDVDEAASVKAAGIAKAKEHTPPVPTPAEPSYKLRPEKEVERERKETRHLGRIFDEIFQEELAAAKTVDTFTAKESELKENIGFALDATADAAANLAYAKIAYDNAQFQFSVAEDIKIRAEQSYREFVFSEAERLNKLPLVDKVCIARNLCLSVNFDIKTQLFKIEHGIAAVAGAKITLGAFKTPTLVESFLLSLLPADDDPPPKPATDDFLATRKALWNKYLTAEAETQKALQDADFENCDPDTKLALHTPAQVVDAVRRLKEAMARGDDNFIFPTVVNLTEQNSCLMDNADDKLYTFMVSTVEELNEKLLPLPDAEIEVKTMEGYLAFIYPESVYVDCDDIKFTLRGDCSELNGLTLGTYDTPEQVEHAVEKLKAAIERGDKRFDFANPGQNFDKRAMKIALERHAKFCHAGKLSDAEDEMKLYAIYAQAMKELGKEA